MSGQHVHHHAAHSVVSAPGSYKTKSFESRVREKKKMRIDENVPFCFFGIFDLLDLLIDLADLRDISD